jgi:hypothetical protein
VLTAGDRLGDPISVSGLTSIGFEFAKPNLKFWVQEARWRARPGLCYQQGGLNRAEKRRPIAVLLGVRPCSRGGLPGQADLW